MYGDYEIFWDSDSCSASSRLGYRLQRLGLASWRWKFGNGKVKIVVVYDFTEDEQLRSEARSMLDLICFGMAVNSYKGVYGCTHGRTYSGQIIRSRSESTRAVQKLMWNIGSYEHNPLNLGAAALATSSYESPVIIDRIALDEMTRTVSREGQSFNVEEAPLLGKGYDDEQHLTLFWHNMAYTHTFIFEQNLAMERKYGININNEIIRKRLRE